jgi:hypothetical protein
MLALLAVGGPLAPPASAVDFGVNALDYFSGPATTYEAQRMRQGGATMMRVQLGWGRLKPYATTPFQWGIYDQIVAGAASGGVEILGLLLGTPDWVAHHVRGWPSGPTGLNAYTTYVQAVSARYGPKGTFWGLHPDLPYRPIRTWEVWSEENRTDMSPAIPNRPTAYAHLLDLTRAALNTTDPSAKIVIGGMTERRDSNAERASGFLRKLFRAKGVRNDFDIVGLHPYGRKPTDPVNVTTRIHKIMVKKKMDDRPIWITEVGWSSNALDRNHPLVVTEKQQAKRLTQSFTLLRDAAPALNLEEILWYSFQDIRLPLDPGTWDQHSGLFDALGREKPAWEAFTKITGGDSGGHL